VLDLVFPITLVAQRLKILPKGVVLLDHELLREGQFKTKNKVRERVFV
jgi:hypothetical protein